MILAAISARNFIALVTLISMAVLVIWIIQRHRREMRRDLQNRGLVPSRRHRHRHSSSSSSTPDKRNPTLAEKGGGLPPVRNAPPPGPTDG